MQRDKRFPNVGLSELLVLAGTLVMLGAALGPVWPRTEEDNRQKCLSNVRQLAVAAQMYNQDNNGRFPGIAETHWDTALGAYLGNDAHVFACPSDASTTPNHNSYGYSGMLVLPDGNGVNESVICAPTKVVVVCDASPSMAYGSGGLVGGGALQPVASSVVPVPRHSYGTVVGYCDGHAGYVPNGYNPQDISHAITQSFFMCNALGYLQNPAGGISSSTTRSLTANALGAGVVAYDSTTLTIGGDMATMPFITAAAQTWKQVAQSAYFTRGFLGMGVTQGRPANYVWGCADGNYLARAGEFPIGKDALVFIVSKNTKIPASYFDGGSVNGVYVASPAALQALFTGNGGTGYEANVFQCYGYAATQGNTKFLNKLGMSIGAQAIITTDDQNMVSLIAADPYGIGFCSSAMADPNQVQILGIGQPGGNANSAGFYPQNNPKYRYFMPAQAAQVGIPSKYIRQLYAVTNGVAGKSANNSKFADSCLSSTGTIYQAIMDGPLFKASYFKQ